VDSFRRWQRTQRRLKLGASGGFLPIVIKQEQPVPSSCYLVIAGLVSIECQAGTDETALELALRMAVQVCGQTTAR